MNRFETWFRARRVLPPDVPGSVYWISIARTWDALQGEFRDEGCLSRERVEIDPTLDDETWRQVVEELCHSRLVIDGLTIAGSTEPPAGAPVPPVDKVVRWYFVSGDLAAVVASGERRQWTIAFDFVERPETALFPVLFSSYYVMGGAQIVFRLYDDAGEHTLGYQAYLASHHGARVDHKVVTKEDLCRQVSITTPDDCLLWPGSGVHIWWSRRPAP